MEFRNDALFSKERTENQRGLIDVEGYRGEEESIILLKVEEIELNTGKRKEIWNNNVVIRCESYEKAVT